MTFSFRPAIREATPLIIGLAGPTKSGKTMSAHRIAVGLANGGVVAMLNAEGARGHQYADRFKYVACDIEAPFSPDRYTEAVLEAKKISPAVLIIDSASHMHDGPGGLLEYHDTELDRMAGDDYKKRERMTWAAWIRPKKDENEFIYTMLGLKCPVILCFRAKEKIKIVSGKPPIDLGWQPIASDRITFETIFTLVLPPHCKGVPDLSISEMREPFDAMIPDGKQLDESLGRKLAEWAKGGDSHRPDETGRSLHIGSDSVAGAAHPSNAAEYITPDQVAGIETICQDNHIPLGQLKVKLGVERLSLILAKDFERVADYLDRQIKAKTSATVRQ